MNDCPHCKQPLRVAIKETIGVIEFLTAEGTFLRILRNGPPGLRIELGANSHADLEPEQEEKLLTWLNHAKPRPV